MRRHALPDSRVPFRFTARQHLRTATACVMGVWIDFVNLRSEAYAADSRIPSVEIGTPLQDAERRDFTLNSMFFNLNSGQIEDQTGRGFTDLRDGIIRTPLPAADTFHDDPLRVLRAVRFAARYGFALTEDIREAIGSEAVVNALDSKVSRERVGKELDGMLKAATTEAVVRAIKLLVNLQLAPHVFRLPDCDMAVADEWVVDGERAVERLQAMAAYQTRLMQEERKDGVDDDAADDAHACGNMLAMPEPVHYLTAMLSPLAGLTYPGKKGKPTAVTSFVMLTSIKQRKKDCALLQKLHAAMATLSEADAGDQLAAAHFARDCQHHWPVPAVLLYGRLHDEELFAHPQLQQVAAFAARRVWQQRPLLSGKDLLRELDLPRGPMVARVVQLQWDAQALQPDIAADELLAVLREKVAAM
eukprot:PLAT11152.2.p1 GENE.PLAT11152.2~~PLAT11152.2.p1  ORF type:complete len:417 (-),score=214.04 PLAT11152.2:59-1309(-)